jgi:predicted enzyme related to lactoylglutathione lyase
MRGDFFWYDLMTTDTQTAADFYGQVIGWGAQDGGLPSNPYTLFTAGGVPVAGLMPIPADMPGARPGWMGYIAVDDVDEAAAKLEREGGAIHRPPTEVPGIIRFAVVSDPGGAGFMIAKGMGDMTPPAAGTVGTVGWRELYSGEVQATFSFYERMFGWTKGESFEMGPMGTYQLFATGAEPVGGMMTKPDNIPVAAWGYYFTVEAINAAAERVKAAGGAIVNGPHQVPGGDWIVQAVDPQGASFALTSKAP